jgi:hypothetical protein
MVYCTDGEANRHSHGVTSQFEGGMLFRGDARRGEAMEGVASATIC